MTSTVTGTVAAAVTRHQLVSGVITDLTERWAQSANAEKS